MPLLRLLLSRLLQCLGSAQCAAPEAYGLAFALPLTALAQALKVVSGGMTYGSLGLACCDRAGTLLV